MRLEAVRDPHQHLQLMIRDCQVHLDLDRSFGHPLRVSAANTDLTETSSRNQRKGVGASFDWQHHSGLG